MNFCIIRRHLGGAVMAWAAMICCVPAKAQTYPARPVTVIVPFAGGSASDVVTRIVQQHRGSVKVNSRPGKTEFIVCFLIDG